ncbi:ATP/GTP-binding protein [Methylomonas sp. DH-1]|uniref:AAA family ATPase n=1 Tax=Methylomonas sp. (strain DH-1) TaxID=1727196 RepID=UPI000A8ECDAB|nr:ATP-binding protein [Methylomonas sp. DH-1]
MLFFGQNLAKSAEILQAMIIDFTVTNFCSIKEEQTFSLYAETPGSYLIENIVHPADDKVGVLKCAGLYGANASGKSNLLLAFHALQFIIVGSGELKEGDKIPCYDPYLLSEANKSSPTRFEIEFFAPSAENNQYKLIRYRYCVAFTANRIIEERLVFYPTGQQASVFDRGISDTWQTISFGSLYKGGKKRLPFFENNTYISKAGDSADSPQMIRNVYNYFRKKLHHFAVNERKVKLNWFEEPSLVKKVSALLSLVDTGISNIRFQEKSESDDIKLPDGLPEEIKVRILKDIKNKPFFAHLADDGMSEYFEEEKESAGTRKFFDFAPIFIEILSNGGVLIMDELDNSMHPFMVELIIKLFNDPNVNKGNAQLIFSTHNINLMSPELLRRDQIWLTEKNKGSTQFFSLDDFDKKRVKPQSPFSQWYLEGRFGGIPSINYQGIVNLLMSGETNA